LIGVQFIASFALIIGTSFMYLQNWFMQNSPLGYDKDNLLTVNVQTIRVPRDVLADKLKSYPGIEDVTFAGSLLANSDMYDMIGMMYKENRIWFQYFHVNYDFLKVMNIDVIEGRDFRKEDIVEIPTSPVAGGRITITPLYIFNDVARKQFGMEVNTMMNGYAEIIGFMSDIKFASFREGVRPFAFCFIPFASTGSMLTNAYIRVKAGANLRETLSYIDATLTEFDPDYKFSVRFFDETLQKLYNKEIALNSLITLFSIISIFISIVGVFGLVMFDSECRRKEIGIRKVLGASAMEVVFMFNKAYFRILVICFALSAPLAWYAVNRWLQNFAYKTPMYWWVYPLSFAIVSIITIFTVTFQNWRVANENPVDAIKIE